MDSVLRPRDIQARIRAGESPEDVAAAAQTSVDRIMGFATPVLAERAYQAELAQKASVRRRAATGPVGHLGQAVESFLEPHGLGADDVEWDAWRREDGRWTVLATYLSGAAQQTARFTYDTGGRFVVADNDEARVLVGERTTETPAPDVDDETPGEPVYSSDSQLALGDDTLGMVLGRRPADAASGPAGSDSGLSTGLGTGSDVLPDPDSDSDSVVESAPAARAEDLDPVDEIAFAPRPDAGLSLARPASPADHGPADPGSDSSASGPADAPAARADESVDRTESGLGTEAIDRRTPADRPDTAVDEPELTEDLSSAARAVRPPVAPPTGTGDADWMVTQASERPAPRSPAATPAEDYEEEALFAAPIAQTEQPPQARRSADPAGEVAPEVGSTSASGALSEEEQSTEEAAETRAARKQTAKSSKARGRASVPSWDEIMFGTPKDQ